MSHSDNHHTYVWFSPDVEPPVTTAAWDSEASFPADAEPDPGGEAFGMTDGFEIIGDPADEPGWLS